MPTDAERQAALEETLRATAGQSVENQARAVQEYLMTEPSQAAADVLWKWLVSGLLVMTAVALIGLVVLVATKRSTDVVLTAFTALLTGLLGLFINPSRGSG